MTDKERAIDIVKNLSSSINKIKINTVGNMILSTNHVYENTSETKLKLKNKLRSICDKYKITKEDLKNASVRV
jgi:hypothetical protein